MFRVNFEHNSHLFLVFSNDDFKQVNVYWKDMFQVSVRKYISKN